MVDSSISTIPTNALTRIPVLVCPFCRKNIPGLSLRLLSKQLSIYVTCTCFEGERICQLEDLTKAKSDISNECTTHPKKKAEQFCLECSSWLCQECLTYHADFAKTHNLIDSELYFECKDHEAEYCSYCHTCAVNYCLSCTSKHTDHKLSPINKVTFPPMEDKYKDLTARNQKMMTDFNQKIDDEITYLNQLLDVLKPAKGVKQFTKEEREDLILMYNKMKSDLQLVFGVNQAINTQLAILYDSILITSELMKNHPLYQLMKLLESIKINESNLMVNEKDIRAQYKKLNAYYKHSYLLHQNSPLFQPKAIFKEHTNYIVSLCQLSDGRLASCSSDMTIKFWDVVNYKCTYTIVEQEGEVSCLLLLRNSLLAASCNKTIKLWSTVTYECQGALNGHTKDIMCLLQLRDDRLASGSWDYTIKLWNEETKECIATLKGHEKCVCSMVQLFDGRLASSSWDCTIRLWDLERNESTKTLTGHTHHVSCILQLNDGRLVSCSGDNSIKFWNVKAKEKEVTLSKHKNAVKFMIELYDERLVSSSVEGTIMIWDINTFACLNVLTGHSDSVKYLLQLKDGRLASASVDKTIIIWDI